MKELNLIKASQAKPFVETLIRLGAPVDVLARAAGLPLGAVREGQGVIGERSLWRLLECALEMEGMEFLGYRTALEHPITSTAEIGGLRMRRAQTLEQLLRFFIDDVRGESSGAAFSLRRETGGGWFRRRQMYPESSASWQAEQYVVCFVIQIVRLCTGPDWLPPKIRIASRPAPCPVPAEWASVEFEWGREATEIRLCESTLALPPRHAHLLDPNDPDDMPNPLLKIDDLVDRQIWSGETGIDDAAYELGLSVTTLKRRLADSGTSYTRILESRRRRWAQHLLAETDLPIAEIARSLGYRYTANFTRAFVRMSGASPRRYRSAARR